MVGPSWDRVLFLQDLTFFHEYENVLGELMEGYEAYAALCELFEPGTEKKSIVEFHVVVGFLQLHQS